MHDPGNNLIDLSRIGWRLHGMEYWGQYSTMPMGTSVASGALTLRQAVIIAAVLEFSGAFFLGAHVSRNDPRVTVDLAHFSKIPSSFSMGCRRRCCRQAPGCNWLHTLAGRCLPRIPSAAQSSVSAWLSAVWKPLRENVAFIATSWIVSPLSVGIVFLIFNFLRRHIFTPKIP